MSLLAQSCRHCGHSWERLMLFAMMQEAGAQTSADPLRCWAREDAGEHELATPRDSDGSPKGEDALAASSETTARAEGIAENQGDQP